MSQRFDLIIFDWDGTLANSIDWIVHCLQTTARSCALHKPSVEEIKNIIGLSLQNAVSLLFPELTAKQKEHFIDCYSQEFVSKPITPDDLFLGVYDMLLKLKQNGYHLAVATGKTRKGLQRALKGTNTENLFNITRCADETASKPNPLMLEIIIKNTGVNLERVLMVGDSIHDLEMAQNIGINSVAVTCGVHSKQILQQYQPLSCLQQTPELLDFIGD